MANEASDLSSFNFPATVFFEPEDMASSCSCELNGIHLSRPNCLRKKLPIDCRAGSDVSRNPIDSSPIVMAGGPTIVSESVNRMTKQHIATMKKQNVDTIRNVTGLATLAVLAGLTPVNAEDAKPEDKGWESSAAAGVTISGGNTKNFQSSLSANSTRKWSKDEALLGAQAGYGESTVVNRTDGEKDKKNRTEAYIKGFGQWNHLFTDRFYGGLRLDAVNDAVADIDYRLTLSPLAGYYLIKDKATTLAVEFGPSLVHEKVGGEEDTYAGLRLAERFEHKFSAGSRIWQSTEIVPQVDDFQNFVATSEIGAEAPLTKKLSVRLVFQHVYDSEPAKAGVTAGGDTRYKLKNDTKLIGALAYKF